MDIRKFAAVAMIAVATLFVTGSTRADETACAQAAAGCAQAAGAGCSTEAARGPVRRVLAARPVRRAVRLPLRAARLPLRAVGRLLGARGAGC